MKDRGTSGSGEGNKITTFSYEFHIFPDDIYDDECQYA
jgi:hypothetical protein